MKKTPALLMKELKYIEQEVKSIFEDEQKNSFAPVENNLTPKYVTNYNYNKNRERLKELFSKERIIKLTLAKFNCENKAYETDLTIAEALVKIAELKAEEKVLKELASKQEYYESSARSYYDDKAITYKVLYDINEAKEDLAKLQKELSALQIAIDTTNLTSFIDC